MPQSNVIMLEDWTGGDPLQLEMHGQQSLVAPDIRALTREIIRLREIERAAMEIMQHVNTGDIDASGPKACYAVVELGRVLDFPVQWRRV